jgi:hypothetical protein
MAQSPEYPDLIWVPPASWTNANRSSVQLIVIHTTEGSEGATSAEDGAAYDARRTDGTSTHFFHDSDSTVQCVRTEDIAHAARHEGNLRGIQHELCGSAYQGTAGWADAVSQGTLRQAARQCARDAKKWGIPVRKLSVAQVADGVTGFCGHVEITYAFPQDNGTHTDPGPTFPWSTFLGMVQDELEGHVALTQEEYDNIGTACINAVKYVLNSDATTIANLRARPWQYAGGGLPGDLGAGTSALLYFTNMYSRVAAVAAALPALADDESQIIAAVNAAGQLSDADRQAIAAAVLAGMNYQGIADAVVAALPQDQAQALLDALAARLQS